ncbi:MAG TPA: glycosyltransferase [Flavisolibacter sp.]|nr:glycosyltransferase [Flavisolibacter sp.]
MKPNILVAPLDWGLGHATRCIPVIHSLLAHGCQVILAGEGKIENLLRKEYPDLPFLHLKGYGVRYSRSAWSLPIRLATQIPTILSIIQYENQRLKAIVKEQPIHGIISDNRYGLYHERVPSVFISHQLRIKIPLGSFAEQAVQKLNYRFINRFHQCWVPDQPLAPGLAGGLSHPDRLPGPPTFYTGPLSRFAPLPNDEPGRHLLVLLSGPEPQRSLLEKLMMAELAHYNGPAVLVRGLPGSGHPSLPSYPSLRIYDHLPSAALQQLMQEASLVISRCGYSTVMDLAMLRKKSILVPTPGQTEQEYLARHLSDTHFAFCLPQHKFRLLPALNLASRFPYRFPERNQSNLLNEAVGSFLELVDKARTA